MSADDDLRVWPGRVRSNPTPRAKPFVALALAAAEKAGGLSRRGARSTAGRNTFGRGRAATLRAGHSLGRSARMVTVKARVVRHHRRSGALSAHLSYLRREGVTRDGSSGRMFDAAGDNVDANAFAERCGEDRHHFRFIVSPEDAAELDDLHTFTRDLMTRAAKDLGTQLDWIAVDHWNTEHPHVHVLVRGRADDGENLVISRAYISHGFRARASERATLELGPRAEHEIEASIAREVTAERWTGLDRSLRRSALDGVVDLRPRFGEKLDQEHRIKIGRMRKLAALGLAEPLGPSRWQFADDAEQRLRAIQRRGDVIARLHDALGQATVERGTAGLVLDGETSDTRVLGRLVARGLDEELTGTAFVVIDGVDGRTHHVGLADLDAASDAPVGAIVETRWTQPPQGSRSRMLIAVRSDTPLREQVSSAGATWLDRQLVAQTPASLSGSGFGAEVRQALAARSDHHLARGSAEWHGHRLVFARNLLATLRQRELENTATHLAAETGLTHRPSSEGEHVSGVVRQRVTLASGRFAMIDDGTGFQLVPWSQPLQQRLGQHVTGQVTDVGRVEWTFGRRRGLSI